MADEKRPEWMTNISSLVDPDEYLLGRKIDKTFELSQKEKSDRAREARIELLAKDKIKLSQDPILDLERRKRELKMELIKNPVMMKQFRDKLLKGEQAAAPNPGGSREPSGARVTDRPRDSSRSHDSSRPRHPSRPRDHRRDHPSGDDRDRDHERAHHDRKDPRARHDRHSSRGRDRESPDEYRTSGARSGTSHTDRPSQLSPSMSGLHHRKGKGKVQVQGSKPEMPAFLQRIKMQIVANEDNERRLASEKRRRERSSVPTNEEDDPTVVKLNDDDLTEAEFKRLKKELETQYKINDCDQRERASEDLDIDQIMKRDAPSVSREGQRQSKSGSTEDRPKKHHRDRHPSSHEVSENKTAAKHRKVLSYGSSSDDND